MVKKLILIHYKLAYYISNRGFSVNKNDAAIVNQILK